MGFLILLLLLIPSQDKSKGRELFSPNGPPLPVCYKENVPGVFSTGLK